MNNRTYFGAVALAVVGLITFAAFSEAARRVPNQNGVYVAGIDSSNDQQIIAVDSNGTQAMGGNVASGATDSGNPVKVGGVYNSTKPTLTNGQRGDLQLGTRGALTVQITAPDGTSVADIDNANNDGETYFGGLGALAYGRNWNGATYDREFTCPSSAIINVAAAATTQLVALASSQVIRVCSFVITGDTAATTATFVYGTGANCGTGTTSITGAMRMVDEGSISLSGMNGSLFRTIASNALCLTAATGAVTGFITYAQY